MTLQQALTTAQTQGLARIDAQMLLLHTLGRASDDRAWLITHDTDTLDPAAQEQFQALCQRRLAGGVARVLHALEAAHVEEVERLRQALIIED